MRPHVSTLPTVKAGSRPWLYGEAPSNGVITGVLDLTKFGTLASLFPDGYIPAGTSVGLVTADGTYGAYNGGSSEVVTITINATGGTFTISYEGDTTGAIAWNATAATVLAALEALPSFEPGNLTVSLNTLVYTITGAGVRSGVNLGTFTTGAGSLTGGAGTAAVAVVTQGEAGAATDGRQVGVGLLLNNVSYLDSAGVTLTGTAAVGPVEGILIRGVIREAKLPTNHGVDAAFKNDARHFQWI